MFYSLLSKIKSSDSDLLHVLLGSGVTLVLKVLGALLSFLVTMLLSNSLGIHGLGVYLLSFTILMLGSNIAGIGLDNAILKFAGSAYSNRDWEAVLGLYKKSILWVTLSSIVISSGLYIGANFLATAVFKINELEIILKFIGLAILPIALFNVHISFFQSFDGVIKSVVLKGILIPILMIVGIYLLTLGEFNNPKNMVLLYSFNSFVNLLICYFIFAKLSKNHQSGTFSTSLLLVTCIPMFWILLAELIAVNSPQLILGAFWQPEDIAIFSVCLRIATLISFILTSASRVVAPRLAALSSKGNKTELSKLASSTTSIMLLIAFIISLFVIIFAEQLLLLFGNSFIAGIEILQIFAVTQLILVISGLGKIVLQMTGFEQVCKKISILNVVVIICLAMLFIPTYGSLGAVYSLLIASIINTMMTVFAIKKELGFYLIGRPILKFKTEEKL